MYIQLMKARKSLYDILKVKNYIILDMEYAKAVRADQKQYLVNIVAKYYKNNELQKEYDVSKMPSNATNEMLQQLAIKKHKVVTDIKTKNMDEYNSMYLDFYKWLSKNSLTKTPIIGWGIDGDLNAIENFFKKNITAQESSRPMFEYDLQESFSNHIQNQGMSLQVASNLLGIKEDNNHMGSEDVDLINVVKNKMKLLVKTFNL